MWYHNARAGCVVLLGRTGLHLGGEGHGGLLLDHAGHGAAVTHQRGLHALDDSKLGIVLTFALERSRFLVSDSLKITVLDDRFPPRVLTVLTV